MLIGEKDRKWPMYIKLSSGSVFGCDLVVSATGVTPALGFSIAAPKEIKVLCINCRVLLFYCAPCVEYHIVITMIETLELESFTQMLMCTCLFSGASI